nr:uncharacterized protein LOC124809345 [Hydra vulgaris]
MVKKCCAPECNGNYDAKNKVRVLRLPSNEEEKNRWINSIPRSNFPNKRDTVVCKRLFPENFLTTIVNGKVRPNEPPSIFPNIPASVVPNQPLKPRSTTKVLFSFRNDTNIFELFEEEESDNGLVLDSDDDEYFPENEVAASDLDDTEEVDENELVEDEESKKEDDDDDDEESEIETPVSGPVMTAKDGTKWANTPTIEHQVARRNIMQERCGPSRNTDMLTILDTFKLFFTPEMADIIIRHTNKKANLTYATYNEKNPGKKQLVWKNLELQELYAFLAILITSGANNSNTDNTKDMWQSYSYPLYRAIMGISRFWNIIRFIRFDDANTRAKRMEMDKAAPIRDIWRMLNNNLAKHYKPTEHLTIDEQLYPYRGRIKFTQYIPLKPAKHGIKVWWICDAENSYPLTGQIYTRKLSAGREKDNGERVVKDLVAPYKGSGRNITMGNYFTTLTLAKTLLSWDLTIVNFLKKNKTCIPPAMTALKTREKLSTVFGFHEKVTMCSYVPKKKEQLLCYYQCTKKQKLQLVQRKNQKLLSFITGQKLVLTQWV